MLDPNEISKELGLEEQGLTVHEEVQLQERLEALARLRVESLKLYEPTPFQDRFHKCPVKERLIQAGNRAGKSLAAFVEVARAVTGQDPYNKYPKENGIAILLGYDEQHIGTVMHKYLFKSGAFNLIRDKETKKWRVWKPWLPEDVERRAESKPAPPLIPGRYIKGGYPKGVAWGKRKTNVFTQFETTTGWLVYARSSKGQPIQGIDADLVHIDEDIEQADWYDELIARLTMRRGKLIWSALPLAKNNALINLAERAERENADDKSSTRVFRATIYDNPHMPDDEREENVKRWKASGEDEYRKRALGELVTDSYLVYPTFSRDVHCLESAQDTKVKAAMLASQGEPPHDWCLYATIDPGHRVGAAMFFAVPPPSMECDQVVAYDEIYILRCEVDDFADRFAQKVQGKVFQTFIIDMHGGNLTPLFGGDTPCTVYRKAFEARGIKCVECGANFRPGCDDIQGREMTLRNWLHIRDNGTPKLLVSAARCPNFLAEIHRFKKKITNKIVQDTGDRRVLTHGIECCEYGVAHGMPYIRPPRRVVVESFVERILKGRQYRAAARRASVFGSAFDPHVTLGPQGVPQ